MSETLKNQWDRYDLPPRDRVDIANQLLDASEARLFACWCVRRIWDLLADSRSRDAIEVAERYALGQADRQALEGAHAQAVKAVEDRPPLYVPPVSSCIGPREWRALMEGAAARLVVHVTETLPNHLVEMAAYGSIRATTPDGATYFITTQGSIISMDRHPRWTDINLHLRETYRVVEGSLVRIPLAGEGATQGAPLLG